MKLSNEDMFSSCIAASDNAGVDKINMDLQKRTDEIRRALLADTEDDAAESFDNLLTGTNPFENLTKWLLRQIPFRRDVSVIKARFGSAVASYFIFCRVV